MNNVVKGMLAGLAGTVALSALMMLKTMMGLMPELDVIKMLSGMMGTGPAGGWIAHFMIGTVLWGALFAWFNANIPGDSQWKKGTVFGIGAWVLMMVAVMPMAGAGFFGLNLGVMAPVMTLVLHIIYGAVMGATYGALLGQAGHQMRTA